MLVVPCLELVNSKIGSDEHSVSYTHNHTQNADSHCNNYEYGGRIMFQYTVNNGCVVPTNVTFHLLQFF